jgi:hypothetical protein
VNHDVFPVQRTAQLYPARHVLYAGEIARGERHTCGHCTFTMGDKRHQRAISLAEVNRMGKTAVQAPLPLVQTV